MADSAYSFSLTTFNPSGKLLQIEYALNAVNNGGKTSLGIRTSNGVVIATEKKLPTILVDETSHNKVSPLTSSAGTVYSGLGPDSRVLVRKARKKAQAYYQVYKEEVPSCILVREIAAIMQEFTQSGGVRPFGVSLLYAGFDDDGPHLYQIDPSGAYFGWKATAIGKDSVNAKTFLERRYNDEMELEDAIHTALLTLREGFEGEMTENGGPDWSRNPRDLGAATQYGSLVDRHGKRGSPVVPGSVKLVKEDSDSTLFSVTILKSQYEAGYYEGDEFVSGSKVDFEDEFVKVCREHRYIVRQFEFDPNQASKSAMALEQLQVEVDGMRSGLTRWCKTHFGEAFVAWMHIKVIRVFVESVLRYGLPVDFTAVLYKAKSKDSSILVDALDKAFGSGEPANDDDEEEYHDFVLLKFEP